MNRIKGARHLRVQRPFALRQVMEMAFRPHGSNRLDFVVAFAGTQVHSDGSGAGIGVLLDDKNGEPLVKVAQPVEAQEPDGAAYRAIVAALQQARGLRAQRVAVFSDNEAVVGQLNRELPVPERLEPAFMQARALMNQFRWAGVRYGSGRRLAAASRAAYTAAASGASRSTRYREPTLPLSFPA